MQILAKAQLCTQNSWAKLPPNRYFLRKSYSAQQWAFLCTANSSHHAGTSGIFSFSSVPSDSDTLKFFLFIFGPMPLMMRTGHWDFCIPRGAPLSLFLQWEPMSVIHLLLLAHCSWFWLSQATSRLGTGYLGWLCHLQWPFGAFFSPQEISCDISVSIYSLHCHPTSLWSLCKHCSSGCSSIIGLLICCICIFLVNIK